MGQGRLEASDPTDGSRNQQAPLLLRDRQLHCALGLHSALYQWLTDHTLDELAPFLIRLLMNPPRRADHADYKQALRVQWRLGERDDFLGNVCRSLNAWPLETDSELWDLVLLAYQQALSVGDPRAVDLEEQLSHWGQYALAVEKAKAAAESDALMRSLTPMGRVSYQTGVMSHDHAVAIGEGWKDAGPISLTFFRTLELELNHRLMKPALREIGADTIHAEWQKLRAAVEAGEDSAVAGIRAQRATSEFWKRNVPVLVKVADGSAHGLELGGLELILRKVVNVSGPDSGLKTLLRNGIRRQLTEEGALAFDQGALAQRIGEEKRERFRNPPAHTRYLPLSVATECRRYVEKTLQLFSAWFVH